MNWWNRKDDKPTVEPALLPGECECGHGRCFHENGKGSCHCAITEDYDGKRLPKEEWGSCACQLFILDEDDGGDDDAPDIPVTPDVEELERIVRT